MEKLYSLTAKELSKLLREKKIKAVDIVNSIFERIDEVEEKVGSFVYLDKEKALEQAKKVDEKIEKGIELKPLEGIPVAIKDNMVSDEEPTTASSKILSNYKGIYDATVVKLIKEEGMILIGKTNMDEFAMGSTTKTSYVKETKNPWDLDRVPGGSSGGSATAIAAQEAILTLGSDTGGSIRQPAAFCGVVGLKPTYGRVSRYGLIAFGSSLDQIGPFGKSVEDVAMFMNVIAKYDEMDSTSMNIETPDYTKNLNDDIKGLKIGIPKEYFIDGMDDEVKETIKNAIEEYKKMGAEIVEISLPHTEYAPSTYYIIAPAEASSNLARFDGIRYGYRAENYKDIKDLYIKTRSEGFGDEVKRRIMIGTYVLSAGYYDAYYKQAQKVRRLIKNDFDKAFENVDVILTPATPNTAFKLTDEKSPVEMYLEDVFTISANLAGIPGIVVPAGKNKNGLPIGMQLLGKHFDETTLLKVANNFEKRAYKIELPENI
ncbi:MAG: aspartyl-tRNA(Asn)/glutamyl-tRNA(Gln) amidotransferase subunit [Fusobacteriaceae bacterium]|jgi:aspartyl-tRNA(Asn)/glutamyl-tRNA(Gln) amidotransferase subunit A|nr:gatA [Fusobacteriales bacterium]MDN5304197.1 aspartyl-tRNA(Asn)/glutamyl-tRNA(Gln) amidotransferase subunit [Fusobacteriaceae bacterium]